MSRKLKDNLLNGLIWLSAAFSVGILITIVAFIFSNGWSKMSWDFLTNDYESQTQYVNVTSHQSYTAPSSLSSDALFSENLGIAIEPNEHGYEVAWIDDQSPVKTAKNNADEAFPVKVGYQLEQINGEGANLKIKADTDADDITNALNASDTLMIKVVSPGGGIFPMIVSTLMLILVALLFSAPVGILAAIYMVEYAKPGKLVNLIRFATEVLSGIPSVVYGLFGMLIFANTLKLGMSITSNNDAYN